MKTTHLIHPLAAFAIISLIATTSDAQEVKRLELESVVTDTLPRKGLASFSVEVDSGMFVYGEVDQITVDVVVTVKSPSGKGLGRFDNPARGPEPFQFNTDTSGTFTVEVAPFREESGLFSIGIMTVEPLAPTPAGRVDQIMKRYDKPGSPGGVIGVVQNGELIFAEGYGLADVESDLPNTPTTPYHMASVTKQFTAFAIAMLARRGKLSLDDDIHKYFPELRDFGKTITLRHLLNHTSGLRDQWNLWVMSGGRMDDVIRQQDLLTLMFNQRELNFDPGEEMLYCNSGYTLLAETVARVSGMSYRDWMQNNIFEPLGMTSTQIYDNHMHIVKGRAYSFVNADSVGYQKAVLNYANAGATSLFSTAEDLAKWIGNWKTGTVGGPEVIRMMQERGVLNNGDTLSYALGIGIDTYRGQRRISHSGGDAGYRTYVAWFPDLDAGVISLGNYGTYSSNATALQAFDAFFENRLEPPAPPQQQQPPQAPADKEPEPWNPTVDDLEDYEGRYYSPELETFYTVSVKDTVLVAYHRRWGDITLTPMQDEGHFRGSQFALADVKFEGDEMFAGNGRVRRLRFERE